MIAVSAPDTRNMRLLACLARCFVNVSALQYCMNNKACSNKHHEPLPNILKSATQWHWAGTMDITMDTTWTGTVISGRVEIKKDTVHQQPCSDK